MLRILFKDGTETKCNGIVKFYQGDQPALCHYDLEIEDRKDNDFTNLKLVYDEDTREMIYFGYQSYGFYKSWDKYIELYLKSKRELQKERKFKEFLRPFIECGDIVNENDILDILVFFEKDIKEIYNKVPMNL